MKVLDALAGAVLIAGFFVMVEFMTVGLSMTFGAMGYGIVRMIQET